MLDTRNGDQFEKVPIRKSILNVIKKINHQKIPRLRGDFIEANQRAYSCTRSILISLKKKAYQAKILLVLRVNCSTERSILELSRFDVGFERVVGSLALLLVPSLLDSCSALLPPCLIPVQLLALSCSTPCFILCSTPCLIPCSHLA